MKTIITTTIAGLMACNLAFAHNPIEDKIAEFKQTTRNNTAIMNKGKNMDFSGNWEGSCSRGQTFSVKIEQKDDYFYWNLDSRLTEIAIIDASGSLTRSDEFLKDNRAQALVWDESHTSLLHHFSYLLQNKGAFSSMTRHEALTLEGDKLIIKGQDAVFVTGMKEFNVLDFECILDKAG